MTLPLPTTWASGQHLTAVGQNATEAAINALGAGTLVIPRAVSVSSAGSLTLTTTYNVYVFTGSTSTWTLPAVTGNTGAVLILFNRGSGAITIQRAGTDNIRRQGVNITSFPVATGGSSRFINDGTYWVILT